MLGYSRWLAMIFITFVMQYCFIDVWKWRLCWRAKSYFHLIRWVRYRRLWNEIFAHNFDLRLQWVTTHNMPVYVYSEHRLDLLNWVKDKPRFQFVLLMFSSFCVNIFRVLVTSWWYPLQKSQERGPVTRTVFIIIKLAAKMSYFRSFTQMLCVGGLLKWRWGRCLPDVRTTSGQLLFILWTFI